MDSKAYSTYLFVKLHEMTPIQREGFAYEMHIFLKNFENVTKGGRKSRRNRKNKRKTRKFKGGAYPTYPVSMNCLEAARRAILTMRREEKGNQETIAYINELEGALTNINNFNSGRLAAGIFVFDQVEFCKHVSDYYEALKEDSDRRTAMWRCGLRAATTTVIAAGTAYATYQTQLTQADMLDQSTTLGMFTMFIDFATGTLAKVLNQPEIATQLWEGRREARSQIAWWAMATGIATIGVAGVDAGSTIYYSRSAAECNQALNRLHGTLRSTQRTYGRDLAANLENLHTYEAARDAAQIGVANRLLPFAAAGAAGVGNGVQSLAGAAVRAAERGADLAERGVARGADLAAQGVARGVGHIGQIANDAADDALGFGAFVVEELAPFVAVNHAAQSFFGEPLYDKVRAAFNDVDRLIHAAVPDAEARLSAIEILSLVDRNELFDVEVEILTTAMMENPENFHHNMERILTFETRDLAKQRRLQDAINRVYDTM